MTGIGKCFWARWRPIMDLSLYALSLYAQRLLARGLEGLGLTLSQAAALQEDGRAQAGAGVAGEEPHGGGRRVDLRPPGDGPPQQWEPVGFGLSRTASSGAPEAPKNSAHMHGQTPFSADPFSADATAASLPTWQRQLTASKAMSFIL